MHFHKAMNSLAGKISTVMLLENVIHWEDERIQHFFKRKNSNCRANWSFRKWNFPDFFISWWSIQKQQQQQKIPPNWIFEGSDLITCSKQYVFIIFLVDFTERRRVSRACWVFNWKRTTGVRDSSPKNFGRQESLSASRPAVFLSPQRPTTLFPFVIV